MEGNEVFKLAVKVMADAANKAITKAGLLCGDIDLLIPHQANIRIIDATCERLKVAPGRVFINLYKYGNMSSASGIVALYEAVKQRKIKRGDYVLMVTFGAGLACGACVIKWNK